ncbi:MCE family protein [Nocardioides ultimimeridianus]
MRGSSALRKRERADLIKFTIFLLVAAIFTVWVGIITASYRPGSRNSYHAVFDDVSGLKVGDEVRVAGVDVGKVQDIEVQPDNSVDVTFSVADHQRLNTATDATIQYKNLIGERVVQLSTGNRNAPPLAVGGTIPVSRTKPALDLDDLLNGFKPLFAGLSTAQINELSGELVQVLQGQESAVSTLIQHVASFTTAIGSREQVVGQVIGNLNAVLGTVDQRRGALGRLITNLSRLVVGLQHQDKQVIGAATQIVPLANEAATLLQSARSGLGTDLTRLTVAARGVNKNAGTLDQVLAQLPKHYALIQDTASFGSFFNFYLCGVQVLTDIPGTIPVASSGAARCAR